MEKARSKFHPVRVLAFMLAFALLIGYAPVSVFAEDDIPAESPDPIPSSVTIEGSDV